MAAFFDTNREYTFLRGFATALNLRNTLKALPFARECHKNQVRNSGEPYLNHPTTMACHCSALFQGVDPGFMDALLATALLHDVCEDCGVAVEALPFSPEVTEAVRLLTFTVKQGETKEQAKTRYYNDIATNKIATIVKLIDRCHNVSTMPGVFTLERMKKYYQETNQYVLPLLEQAMLEYPDCSTQLFVLKYHLSSLLNHTAAGIALGENHEQS